MRAHFTPQAEIDLEEVGDYIALDNRRRAASFIREIRQHCEKIADGPNQYVTRPDLGETCPGFSAANDPIDRYSRRMAAEAPFRYLSPSIAPKQLLLTINLTAKMARPGTSGSELGNWTVARRVRLRLKRRGKPVGAGDLISPGTGTFRRHHIAASLLLISGALTACGPGSASPPGIAPVLLFAGTGTSPNDVAAIEAILSSSHLSYSTVNSFQLNGMTESQISRYRLLIVPGGNFVAMGNSLAARTTANVRNAVKGGLKYLGICAGGFLAGSFPAPYNSFNLTSGVQFGFYSPEKSVPGHWSLRYETRKASVRITTPEGPALDQYWESGPQFTGWGEVVGQYPDGTPAIVEGFVGQGQVILSGVHPEAPAGWRAGMVFNAPVSEDTAYARMLIFAALNGRTLSHY